MTQQRTRRRPLDEVLDHESYLIDLIQEFCREECMSSGTSICNLTGEDIQQVYCGAENCTFFAYTPYKGGTIKITPRILKRSHEIAEDGD